MRRSADFCFGLSSVYPFLKGYAFHCPWCKFVVVSRQLETFAQFIEIFRRPYTPPLVEPCRRNAGKCAWNKICSFLTNESIENVKHQKDLGIINSQVLKRLYLLSAKLSKAQKLYFLFCIQLHGVLHRQKNSLSFQVVFSFSFSQCILLWFGWQNTVSSKKQIFLDGCLKVNFWSKLAHQKQLIKCHHLPVSLLIEIPT